VTCSLSLHHTPFREYSEALQESYADDLDRFATVLVEDFIWETKSPVEYTALLASSGCLNTIHIFFTRKHNFNTDGWVEYSDSVPLSDEQVPEYANQLRAEYGEACLDHPEGKSTGLEAMDQIGQIV